MNGQPDDTLFSWERGGFVWHERANVRRGTLHAIAVAPLWSLTAVTAALPIVWTTRLLCARRARTVGVCPSMRL